MMILKRFVDGLARGSGARTAFVLLGLLALCCVVGCSEGAPCSLKGQVTFAGEPVEDGSIRLNPTGDTPPPGGSAKIMGGSYDIPTSAGMFAGKYTVMIMATRSATPQEIAAMNMENEGVEEEPQEQDEDEEGEGAPAAAADGSPLTQYIPEKYNSSTTLTVELGPGENTEDFALEP